MIADKEKSETIKPDVNSTKNLAISANYTSIGESYKILNDHILMEIFDYMDIQDLFRWLRVSKQFFDCIFCELKLRKHLIVVKSDFTFDFWDNFGNQLCSERQHFRTGSDYLKNNIKSAAYLDLNEIYDFNDTTNLISISQKCQFVECLPLKECYLNAKLFQCLNKNLKHLKCISFIHCFISIFSDEIEMNLKRFSDNIIHLFIEQLKQIEDLPNACKWRSIQFIEESLDNRQIFWSFIKSFNKLKELHVDVEMYSEIEQIFRTKILSLETLTVNLKDSSSNILNISWPPFETENISHLKNLDIKDHFITRESMELVINDMNLKSFAFSCLDFSFNLLSSLAEKHNELTKLSIYWSVFQEDSDIENTFKFNKVRHFALHSNWLNNNDLKQLFGLFPALKVMIVTHLRKMNCHLNIDNDQCQTCRAIYFDSIPRMDSIKKLVVSFVDMNRALVESLNLFPNLKHMKVCDYTSSQSETTTNNWNLYFRDIVEYLSDKCRQTPTKAFKLYVCENIAIPDHIVIPKNLKIVRQSDILSAQ